jgi:hypothetical protein
MHAVCEVLSAGEHCHERRERGRVDVPQRDVCQPRLPIVVVRELHLHEQHGQRAEPQKGHDWKGAQHSQPVMPCAQHSGQQEQCVERQLKHAVDDGVHGEKQREVVRIREDGGVLAQAVQARHQRHRHQVDRVREVDGASPAQEAVVAFRAHEIQLVLLLESVVRKEQAVSAQRAGAGVVLGNATHTIVPPAPTRQSPVAMASWCGAVIGTIVAAVAVIVVVAIQVEHVCVFRLQERLER